MEKTHVWDGVADDFNDASDWVSDYDFQYDDWEDEAEWTNEDEANFEEWEENRRAKLAEQNEY